MTASDEILALRKTEDPKSLFQEWAQSEGFSAPQYITRNSLGPDHSKMFEVDAIVNGKVYGSGQGHSKQAAAKAAARDALHKIGFDGRMTPRLKSLELHGYKTFASRTVFEFPGDITAIVGPNGSGKSNIADSAALGAGRAVVFAAARAQNRGYDLCRVGNAPSGGDGFRDDHVLQRRRLAAD